VRHVAAGELHALIQVLAPGVRARQPDHVLRQVDAVDLQSRKPSGGFPHECAWTGSHIQYRPLDEGEFGEVCDDPPV